MSSVTLPPGVTHAEGTQGVVGLAADQDSDGLIDAVVVADADGNIFYEGDTTTVEGFDAAREVLQQNGLDIQMDDQVGEYITALSPEDVGGLVAVSNSVKAGESDPVVQQQFESVVTGIHERSGPIDINALVQFVLRASYLSTTEDLRFYAEKVQFYNEVKRQIRDRLTESREILAKTAGYEDETALSGIPGIGGPVAVLRADARFYGGTVGNVMGQALDELGNPAVAQTRAELESYIQGLEEQLGSVGDDAQLANVDLQNVLQKQQQTLQMMSNIAKMLHDTAMAVIRKIGA